MTTQTIAGVVVLALALAVGCGYDVPANAKVSCGYGVFNCPSGMTCGSVERDDQECSSLNLSGAPAMGNYIHVYLPIDGGSAMFGSSNGDTPSSDAVALTCVMQGAGSSTPVAGLVQYCYSGQP